MSAVDLTALVADAVADNPDRVSELEGVAAAMEDTVPVVMLPVRIETRFVRVPAPVAVPVTLADLAHRLSDAAIALSQIAATKLATSRRPTVKQMKQFKDEVENPMCDLVSRRLDTADLALRAADLLLRQNLDGDPRPVTAAMSDVRSGLEGAAASIVHVRSDWQRGRLQTQLAAVAAHAATTLATVERGALPAAALRTELAPSARAPTGGPTIPASTLAAGAATFKSVLEGVQSLGADPTSATRLAGAATTIPLLPASYKQQLSEALAAAQARGTVPPADLGALAAAVQAIPTDAHPGIQVAEPTQLVDRLLVRIYPDDLAVDTHEQALTAAERDAGTAYWQQHSAAGGDAAAQRAAWRALCAGRGSARAAWIAHVTAPPEPSPAPGAESAKQISDALTVFERRIAEVAKAAPGTRIGALLKAAQTLERPVHASRGVPESAIDGIRARWRGLLASLTRLEAEAVRAGPVLDPSGQKIKAQLDAMVRRIDTEIGSLEVLPAPPPPPPPDLGPLKEGAWTRAARSGVLPERFLVIAVASGRAVHVIAGNPVPADLKLSIDPAPQDPQAEQFTVDANGDLVVGASIRWMVDYDEALANGMAVTVPISETEALSGFDRIYAIGLQSGGAADGAGRLGDLLDNHHYGPSGLALVPVGTPTNNTEQSTAGFRSSDDPDDSFPIEAAAPLFDPTQPAGATAADGLRLARALGVDPDTFVHVEHAGGRDGAEAQTATAAFYPGTIGSWLLDNAAGLISPDTRARLGAFALAHVAARGLVPALRVGPQPYGVLPAIAHTHYVPDAAETVAAGAPATEIDAQQRFDSLLAAVLAAAAEDWAQIRDARVAYATQPGITDPRAQFLELLGLEAVSATAAYRFAVNVAGRHGIAAGEPDLQFGVPSSNPAADPTAAQYGPFALLERFKPVLAQASGVDPNAALLDAGNVAAPWADVYTRLEDSRAYELRMLTGTHQLTGSLTGSDPAADISALLSATPAALAAQTRGDEHGRSLLVLLVRQARLAALRDAALQILVSEQLLSEQDVILAGASTSFVVPSLMLSGATTVTPWTFLLASMRAIGRRWTAFANAPLSAYLNNGQLSMADFLTGTSATGVAGYHQGAYDPVAAVLSAHAAALSALAAVPVERLGPLIMEHLDLAGHRLDAWITGLAHRRLIALRSATPIGAHVGAYGWVEDLRPNAGHPLATNVPAALQDPAHPIHADPESEGFVHAPSLNHAVTAAILRGGYVSQRNEGDVENRMAVNLSSRRTRLATGLIDGVRAGNTLGALLGYRLERFLHDYHAGTGVTLDAVIGPLRAAFPSVGGVDTTLNDNTAELQVCDGLAIANTVLAWIDANASQRSAGLTVYDVLSFGNYSGYPWGLGPALPPLSDRAHLDGVVRAIDHVADALDALGDIVLAEGVHQLVIGNHARAAAVLSALGEGKAPPVPEVVATPRTGATLTHRILLALADAPGQPASWEALPMTPRATAEPVLNAWAAGLIGDPSQIRIRLVESSSGLPVGEVTVAELGLHALDLVAILGPGLETGLGEIASRAIDVRRPADLDDDTPPAPLQVDISSRATAWSAGTLTLTDIAPLIEAIGALTGRARAAGAQDYVLSEQAPAGSGTGLDIDELEQRVVAAHDALEAVAVDLVRLLADDATLDAASLPVDGRAFLDAQQPVPDPPHWGSREDWHAVLLSAAAFGIPAAMPPPVYQNRVQVRRALRAAAETAFVEIVQRLGRAAAGLSATPATSPLLDAAAAIFGAGVAILPRAALRNRAELDEALAAEPATATQLDGWLEGLAAVRESCAGLADLLALADAHGAGVPTAAVAQLPHVAGDPWMGDALPAGAAAAGRLSLAIFNAAELPADGTTGVALVVDEWTETVPSAAETTGVAIHYDQPDSTSPQCVLVAVPAEKRGQWQLGALVQTLHDTFELAKSRAVELEHLQSTMYGQLLPALAGEVVPNAVGTMPAGDDRVILDFGATG